MKTSIFSFLLLLTLISCGQTQNNNDIYDKIAKEICNCSQTKSLQKASVKLDSCISLSIKNYEKALHKINIDNSTPEGHVKFINEVMHNRFEHSCSEVYSEVLNETELNISNTLIFSGKLISQIQKADKTYITLTLESLTTKEKKEFHSTILIPDDYKNDEIKVEYEIVKNVKSGKDELIVKSMTSVTVRAKNK